jgi:hypothetical protein
MGVCHRGVCDRHARTGYGVAHRVVAVAWESDGPE